MKTFPQKIVLQKSKFCQKLQKKIKSYEMFPKIQNLSKNMKFVHVFSKVYFSKVYLPKVYFGKQKNA